METKSISINLKLTVMNENISIKDLDISTRCYNVLSHFNIKYVNEIPSKLDDINKKYYGSYTLKEINDIISKYCK